MRQWMMHLLLMCGLGSIAGCQQYAPVTIVPTVAPTVAMPLLPQLDLSQVASEQSLTTLTAEQLAQVQQFMARPDLAAMTAQERLGYYLSDVATRYEFHSQTTNAQTAFRTHQGNCVTLALLTKGLADAMQVPIRFRVTYRDPVLDIHQDILISAAHVRSYLDPAASSEHAEAIVIDYFRESLDYLGAAIDHAHFMALAYNNFAAEALLRHDLPLAKANTVRALQLAPRYVPAVNLMAVLLRREGEVAQAQQWYQYGLAVEPTNITLLVNYQYLAQEQQDAALVQQLQRRIEQLPETDNPYAWFSLAVQAERRGDTRLAMHFYKKLLAKAPYLQPANQALLKLLLADGKLAEARALISTALQYSYTQDQRQLFEKKQQALSQLP